MQFPNCWNRIDFRAVRLLRPRAAIVAMNKFKKLSFSVFDAAQQGGRALSHGLRTLVGE